MLHELIKSILDQLFVAEWRRLDKSIERLNQQNNEINGVSEIGFILDGMFFRSKETTLGKGDQRVLAKSLEEDGKLFLQDKKTITTDQQMIKQSLVHLLKSCKTEQDIRDTLPECVIPLLPLSVRTLSRTRETAFTINDNERAKYQYGLVYPRIEFYSAARLIY